MESFKLINDFVSDLYKKGESSFGNINSFKECGILDEKFEELKIKELLNKDFSLFLEMLFDNNQFYFYKKLTMTILLTPWLNPVSEYALCRYLDNIDAYKNFPVLIKTIIDKTDITYYKSLSLNDIKAQVYKYFDVKDKVNGEKIYCEFNNKPCLNTYIYNKYDSEYGKPVNVFDKKAFFIWAEHHTYDIEKNQSTSWVSRYYGDGYGFDIYSFDTNLWREKLIEVKSGSTPYFTLSENEVNVMRNAVHKNADYYIYKYTYNQSDNKIYTTILRYDNELDALIDNDMMYNLEKIDNGYIVKKSEGKKLILKR